MVSDKKKHFYLHTEQCKLEKCIPDTDHGLGILCNLLHLTCVQEMHRIISVTHLVTLVFSHCGLSGGALPTLIHILFSIEMVL